MPGMYDLFETDKDLERNGVWYDYGAFRVKLRFAGGANKAYLSLLETTMKPYRRAIDQGLLPPERLQALLQEVFSKTMVAAWQIAIIDAETGEVSWKDGIEAKDGTILPVTPENIIATFRNLQSLFTDLIEQGSKTANYRLATLEDDAKN